MLVQRGCSTASAAHCKQKCVHTLGSQRVADPNRTWPLLQYNSKLLRTTHRCRADGGSDLGTKRNALQDQLAAPRVSRRAWLTSQGIAAIALVTGDSVKADELSSQVATSVEADNQAGSSASTSSSESASASSVPSPSAPEPQTSQAAAPGQTTQAPATSQAEALPQTSSTQSAPAPQQAQPPPQASTPAPLDDFKLTDEAAKKLLQEEEEKRKLRRRNKGRIRELEEIRAELAEKELILLEKEKELLAKEQTLVVLKEELDLERKLRALLSKEKEKAEEEAALAMGLCTGGAMLP